MTRYPSIARLDFTENHVKTAQLLDLLDTRLSDLDQRIAPLAGHDSITPRFDRQRFRTTGRRMQDFLDEIHANVAQLRACATANETEQVAWLAQTVALQIEALQREAASWQLRTHDSAHTGLGKLHKKLLEHQEFERRLIEMKRERELRVAEVDTLVEQQQLHREIDALEGRLARCRDATQNLERALTRLRR
ncbi:primosomal replication protein PriC [Siccibacter colletis]|uniref:primosomal replication protein PriC n=1 Tax=Siccibacter colletis TaxID=1505757 RepID=UPI003CF6D201